MISGKRIYLSSPHLSGAENEYVVEAFDSNWVAPNGPHIEAFQKELAEYVNIKGAVALSSGTAAIHLALKLLEVGPGDRVFCSTFTFVASANPIIYLGAEPVFIDSEPSSWNMSPLALQQAFNEAEKIGKLPKAVIVVSLYGQSADMTPIANICNSYGVPIIEDSAEALGSTYKGRACGTLGKFGIYSFNGNKIITTSGGGMLISDDIEALERAKYLATQARQPEIYYLHSELGYNYRLSNVLAGIGRAQLKVLNDRIYMRRGIYERYYCAFGDVDYIDFMPEASYGRSTRWLTALTIDPEKCDIKPLELVKLLALHNIEARPVWKPLHSQPVFRGYEYYCHNGSESVSDKLFSSGICLPSGTGMTEEEQSFVIKCMQKILVEKGYL